MTTTPAGELYDTFDRAVFAPVKGGIPAPQHCLIICELPVMNENASGTFVVQSFRSSSGCLSSMLRHSLVLILQKSDLKSLMLLLFVRSATTLEFILKQQHLRQIDNLHSAAVFLQTLDVPFQITGLRNVGSNARTTVVPSPNEKSGDFGIRSCTTLKTLTFPLIIRDGGSLSALISCCPHGPSTK